jgi:hypothetical protein
VTDHATTGASGQYLFTEAPGTYTVTVDASNFASGGALVGSSASPTLQGGDATKDSNPSPSGTTPAALPGGSSDLTLDFGYFQAAVNIVKLTNGTDNDAGTGPLVPVGSTVTWTYNVTNPTHVSLANVAVTDNQAGVTPAPVLSGGFNVGDANHNNLLDFGEQWVFTASGTATAGQYGNVGTVTGTPVTPTGGSITGATPVSATNPDHYFGATPSVTIIKLTNNTNNDGAPVAGTPDGPVLLVGSPVTWTYNVTNPSSDPFSLSGVTVTDSVAGVSPTPVLAGGFNVGDSNHNNLLDPGETWQFTASGVATNGQYSNVGTVVATPVSPTGGTFPGAGTVTANNPDHYFGYQNVTVGDFVWNDSNANGVQDSGEAGINGVTLTLAGTDFLGNPVTDHATTGGNGGYLFTEKPGTYTVTVDASNFTGSGALVGYNASPTGKGTTATDSNASPSGTTPGALPSGGSDLTVDFGYYKNVTVGDFVWNDSNANGVQDSGEAGLNGVTLTLTGTNGAGVSVTDHATTSGNGAYLFSEAPGTYTVTVDASNFSGSGALAGYTVTPTLVGSNRAIDSNASPSGTSPGTLSGGASDLTVDFGYFKNVTVGDFVWNDLNGNGVQDSGEPGIQGVTLTLTGTNGLGQSVTDHATTGASGQYLFTEAPGTYTVTVDASNFASGGALVGYLLSPTLVGTNRAIDSNVSPSATSPATLAGGGSDVTVDFGFYKLASPSVTTTPFQTSTTTGTGTFATIGFWHNQNGQALIKSFDGGPTATQLGNSLATGYKNLFGYANPYTSATLGAAPGATPGLAGLTNTQVAAVYLGTWKPSGLQKNTYVQAFAVALGLYAGGGAGTFNVGSNGAAFGVSDGTPLSVGQVLAAVSANFNPTTGLFYGGDSTLTSKANNVLDGINTSGESPGGTTVVSSTASLMDSATLTGGYHEGGTLTFYLMGPGSTASTPLSSAVYTDVVTVNGDGTYTTAAGGNAGGFLPTATGTYQWVVVYAGDTLNKPATSPFGSEPWTVGTQTPTIIITVPTPTAVTLSTGAVVLKDAATLQDGNNPTGTITWTLVYNGATVDTETITVSGNGTYVTPTGYTLPTGSTVTGTYQWNATYSGDAKNAGDSETNAVDERVIVSPAGPTIGTTPGGTVTTGAGTKLTDSATLSGGYHEGGTLTFYLMGPGSTAATPLSSAVYTDVVPVNGDGTYTTAAGGNADGYLPTATGTYQWVVVYGGNGNNNPVTSPFGSEPEVVVAPVSFSGTVFCDTNLNGVLDAGDVREQGAVVTLAQGGTVVATKSTDASGNYSFAGLTPGTYVVSFTTPSSGHLAELSHGSVTVPQSYAVTLTSGGASSGNNFAEVDYGSISGYVYLDVNDSGIKGDVAGETGIAGVTVTLTGTDYVGNAVSKTATTDSSGKYVFSNLLPSNSGGYALKETQPAGYLDGLEGVGTVNGVTVGAATGGDGISCIVLPGCNNDAVNYDFGEHGIFHGLTATIGFWHNQNGQALIKSFGTTSNGLTLANWLATTYPNLFGKNAPAFNVNSTIGTNLTNRSDTDVANYFLSLFGVSGDKSYAQVLATAFAVFTTTKSLNYGTAGQSLATKYGFALSNTGTGAATYTVPSADWSAFGITSSSGALKTISQLLALANTKASAGKLNGGNSTLITETSEVFNAINNQGDIGSGMALVTGSGGEAAGIGRLYAGTYLVSVDLPSSDVAADELARIEDALGVLNETLGQFGVTFAELDPAIDATPDVQLRLTDDSVIGGVAAGVLGVTEVGGKISIITGWDYYFGTNPDAVGAGEYDFQTVVTHELGHAVGLGHSTDTQSVMSPTLDTGTARRDLTASDLSVLEAEEDGTPEPLLASHAVRADAVPAAPAPVAAAAPLQVTAQAPLTGAGAGAALTLVASPATFASGQAVSFAPAPSAALQGVFSFTPSLLPGPNVVTESAIQTSFPRAVEAEASGLLSLANQWGASRQDGSSTTGSRPAATSAKETALDALFQGWELGGESWGLPTAPSVFSGGRQSDELAEESFAALLAGADLQSGEGAAADGGE